MKTYASPDDYVITREAVITVGNFDGVHKGHALLVTELAKTAGRMHKTGLVVTFEPHTRTVIGPD